MEGLTLILTIILTILADIKFSQIMLTGTKADAALFYFIFILPIMTIVFGCIIGWVVSIIVRFIPHNLYYTPKEPERKPRKRKDLNVTYACEAILKVADALKDTNIDTTLRFDGRLWEYSRQVKFYMYINTDEAAYYYNLLSEFLVQNATTVSQLPVGYAWLKSVDAIR